MTKSRKLLKQIFSFYEWDLSRQDFEASHLSVIDRYLGEWNDVTIVKPIEGSRVFAIQDLTFLGKGKFVGPYYYYEEFGFVANKTDDDGYGYITHWISFDAVDVL